jgi:hypothetical protein
MNSAGSVGKEPRPSPPPSGARSGAAIGDRVGGVDCDRQQGLFMKSKPTRRAEVGWGLPPCRRVGRL